MSTISERLNDIADEVANLQEELVIKRRELKQAKEELEELEEIEVPDGWPGLKDHISKTGLAAGVRECLDKAMSHAVERFGLASGEVKAIEHIMLIV